MYGLMEVQTEGPLGVSQKTGPWRAHRPFSGGDSVAGRHLAVFLPL